MLKQLHLGLSVKVSTPGSSEIIAGSHKQTKTTVLLFLFFNLFGDFCCVNLQAADFSVVINIVINIV